MCGIILIGLASSFAGGRSLRKQANPYSGEMVAISIHPTDLPINHIDAQDVNRDGYPDLLVGPNLYLNPAGKLAGTWKRIQLDPSVIPLFFLNVDDDGLPDILGYAHEDGASTKSTDQYDKIYWIEALDPEGIKWSNTIIKDDMDLSTYSMQRAQSVTDGRDILLFNKNGSDIFAPLLLSIPENPEEMRWNIARIYDSEYIVNDPLKNTIFVDLNLDGLPDQIEYNVYSNHVTVLLPKQ